MDPISDIFQTLQIDALVQSRLSLSSPWALSMDMQAKVRADDMPFAHRPGTAFFGMLARGHCWLKVEGNKEIHALTGGDCFLVAPNVSFRISDHPRSKAASFCSLRDKAIDNVVHYGGGGAPTSIVWGLLHFRHASVRPWTSLLPEMLLVRNEATETVGLRATVQLLASEMERQTPGSEVTSNRLAEVLFVQILRTHIATHSSSQKSGWIGAIFDPQIGKAMRAFHEDIKAAWTVDTMAQTAQMSRSSFAARFRVLLGETPMQYVASWRMQKSLELLERSGAKLSEVGPQVGYETDAAFSKAFKRVMGMTPGQYRAGQLVR